MKWKKEIRNLKAYQPGKSIEEVQKQYGLPYIVKLASNENPFGCSKKVNDAVCDLSSIFSVYPDGHASELRAKLAKHLNVSPDQIILGNGSDEVIQMISRALLSPDTNTVMPVPTFPQYRHNAVIEGCEIREIPLINGGHDLTGMKEAIDEKTSVVWLCSPNNPTGVHISRKDLMAFLSAVPKETLVVLDEAYYEYITADDYENSIMLIEKYQNVMVLRTFSKIYGLAAFRVGYGVGSPAVIAALEPVREPFNVNTLAQHAAVSALDDQEFVNKCKIENEKGLRLYYHFCDENGLKYYPSQGNFIFIEFNASGDDVFRYLLKKGYIVRSGQAFGFPNAVRITIGSEEQNSGLINALVEFLRI